MGKHKGFTLIEVMLFLAVSAALFAGIAMSMQSSLTRQEYNDTAQSFFELMRSVYSQVSNPESPKKGNSEQAIYGKLIVFGQTKDVNGTTDVDSGNVVFIYDVLGDVLTADDPISGSVGYLLNRVHAGVVIMTLKNTKDEVKSVDLALSQKYELRWGATIDTTAGGRFKGAFLVVRHPKSGVINTLFSDDSKLLNINSRFKSTTSTSCVGKKPTNAACAVPKTTVNKTEEEYNKNNNSIWKSFKASQQILCINPNTSVQKLKVVIAENARNVSGVQMLDSDASGSDKCK